MYAIVRAGGRQVKMVPGETLLVDRIPVEAGAEISFDEVLLVEKDGGEIVAGAPFVANAKVVVRVDGETRGPKVRVFMKKRRKTSRRSGGHRTTFTRGHVKDIVA